MDSRYPTPSLAARLNALPVSPVDRNRYVRELASAEEFADDVVGLVRAVHRLFDDVAAWFGRIRPSFAR